MFALKQLIKPFMLPPGCWLLLLLVCVLYWKRRWSRALLVATLIMAWAFSTPLLTSRISWLLESRYPPIPDPRTVGSYDAIVTLTGSAQAASGLIPFPRLSEAQQHRLEETRRLYLLSPKPIIVSGGEGGVFNAPQGVNRIVCEQLVRSGIPPEQVLSEDRSRDTFESARAVREILSRKGWRRYLLVTSANHMIRSMLVFRRFSPEPIPAPGDFTVPRHQWSVQRFLPSASAAGNGSLALYEILGLINYRVRLYYD